MFSVRIVNSDFYLADPIANLDVRNSTFREEALSKVPVIRVYGATPGGQKTCLHVHGIFPYIYVPYDGTQPTDKYLKQFATSVDFAVQVALGRASSSRQHVYEITVVRGIPYYGYHEGERDFLKIVLYNPFLVTRVVSLLQNGAIMKKVFQPHEAHIPYLLQFFMDYNLYGMNLLHVSSVKFRSPVRLLDGDADTVTSSIILRSNSPQSTPTTFAASRAQIWNEDTVSKDWVLGSDVERLSFCELEVDVQASDILNKLEIGVNVGKNPGLAAIWEDEQQRRREANESSQISAPPTQERGFIEETETEKKFKERIKEIIEERDVLVQSQIGKLGREALSPQELASFQDSMSSLAASQKYVAGDISSDADALLQLLSQTADDSATESSQVVIDEDEPVVNKSIVQEVVEASQRSFSQDLSSSLDKEMVDILTSLAEESSQPASQKTALSQSILLDQGDGALDEEANDGDDEELSEADESIMMSQRVWDDIEPQLPETGDEQMTDVQENDISSQRASQYDLEGMSDTWVGSFLGGDIPQLDGAADEDSDGKEDFKLPRGKRRKGNPRYQADKMSNKSAVMLPATRGNSQGLPVNPEEFGKTEESGKSLRADVWPQTARTIRTYSKKGMSVLKSQRSPTLHEVDRTATKDKEDIILTDTEKEVEEKKLEDCEDEFRLFLSDSSDSEDNMTKEANLGSKRNEVIGRQKNDPSFKAIKRNSSSVRKDQGTSDEGHTPVITKYFHSPEKNTEHVTKQNEETPSSMNDPPGSSFAVGEHSPAQISPHCSKQRQEYSRKSTLRKRKLAEVGKMETRLSKRTSLRRTRQNADSAASLNIVAVAMADVRVFIKDVSETPALSSKFAEAQKRLGRRRENLRENFTQVNISSPARKQRLPGTSSPLRLRKNEKSPLSKKKRSPNRREERMKKYGTLPIVIAKSPKKNFNVDNVAPDTSFVTEEKRLPADSSSASRQCQDEPSLYSSHPRVFPAKLNSGTGRVSSRSRTRVSRLFSSRTMATTTADDKKETSCSVPLSSRGLSLKSESSSSRDKSHGEKDHALSFQRKGFKRKLKLDTEKDVQSATVKVLPGVGKNRKLTLTPKEDKSRPDFGDEGGSKTFASSAENRFIEEQKSTCEVKDEVSSTQHVGFGIEDNDSSLRSGNGKDFALNTCLSDDIICIPCSPGESDSNDKSPNRGDSSASVAEWTSFPVSTKTCNKSEDESNAPMSDEREHRPPKKVKSLELVSQETYFPEEKDTELLANALFNMSYPSPLPYMEECHSPPCPSSPLDTKRDTSGLGSQHNIAQQQEFFSVNSSIVEEDSKVSDDVELERIPASCLSQIHENAFFSPADLRLREKSLHLQMRPQLGETQSQFENTYSEYSDTNVSKQLECKSTENENSANSFDQIVDDKELSCDKESFNVSKKNEDATMEESMIERRKDSEFNSEPAILEEKSLGQKIVYGSKSNESFAGLESRNSMRTESLMQTRRTYLAEAMEPSTVVKEFILELSTADDSSSDSQPLVRGDLQTKEMEISVGEENQVQRISSECTRDANAPVSPTIREDHNKSQNCSTHVKQSGPNSSSLELRENDRLAQENLIVIEPLKRPPTSQELINSLKDYGLPRCRYQEPFCSDPDDIPACPREVGGRILRIESKQVSNLPEFESSSSLQGLKHWRFVLSSARECSVRNIYQSIEDATNIDKNLQLKMALMGEGEVVIKPCRGPPTYKAVEAWARDKLAKRGLQKQETEPAMKKPELKQTTSNDGNLEKVGENQLLDQTNAELVVSNTAKIELGQAMPVTSTPKVPPLEVTTLFRFSSVDTEFKTLLENKHKALDVVESEQNMDVMDSSDSSTPVEVTSPSSLFSPNEAKMFTFASGTTQEIAQCKSVKSRQAENQHLNTITGTQPMKIDKALTLSAQNDEQFSEPKDALTSSPGSVTVTPSALNSPDGTPRQCASTTKQPLSPILQSQSTVFAAPYHSTPVATKLVYGVQSPRCTPISDATKAKRLKTNAENSGKNNLGNQASSDQTPSMRQQLLSSQFKFVTPGSEPRRLMPWSSQIEGPSPNNTYGFKVTQVNLKDAKALHEVQHLTLFSLELHVRTRREARPDPEFDPICAIFYYIQTDTPLASGKNKITGMICVDSESFKICNSKTENKDRNISNTETTALLSTSSDAVASTSSTNNTSVSRTAQTSSTSHLRPLLSRSGVTDHTVQYVAEEKDLFPALITIIRKWDPDILIGYEVQMFSWGFLLERALTFEIDLCTRLSRVRGSSSASNMDAEKDRWGAAHTSEIKIAGRIILNVWRLMRHEVTLNSYSFENVAFHVLHERFPLYTFRTLSDWWDHRTSLNRWRTVDHYVRRCRGNVRILESVDFIGRTSELARLFGILFFSVICRGSQYRVESMMLRIAKPMNYIAVSPSVEQRGLMRAPEVIPLVMEPESRFYSDPVLVLDFQSLYPSMIIAYNYCFSTCLGRVSCLSEYGEFKFGATSLCVPPSLLKKLEGDIHVSPNGVAFVKSNVRRGILPSMLDEILQTRIMVKASMKKWKNDKSLGRMLDARQLGLKLIANVTYGYTSAHFSGRMPCVEIGDSIVRKARETLERAIDLVNNTPRWGARVVYGDTDSLFVLLKGATKEQAFDIGKDIVDTVTAMNPKPVKLKFEKVYLPCVLQTKKRYVGYMYETLDQKEPVFDAKGIETVRRDSCPAVAKVLEKSLRFLFETRDLSLIKKFVQRQCTKLMEGRASLQDFTFAKEYRGMKNYKPGACVPALELTRRMLREDRRSEPRVGERVPYVVVYGSPGLPLIQLVRRPHEVLQDPGLRLNASYYITKQILPPLNRVFSLIGLDVFTWYADLPRVVRVAQMPTDPGERKKGTISQYFSTMTCPVCQELTPTDLCTNCRARPQLSAVSLASRMRRWERSHQHLAEICYSCCGSRDTKLSCVSLDCPVFYKLVLCTRDLKSSQHLRRILESL